MLQHDERLPATPPLTEEQQQKQNQIYEAERYVAQQAMFSYAKSLRTGAHAIEPGLVVDDPLPAYLKGSQELK